MEQCFYGTLFFPGPDNGFVSPFAEYHLQRSDDNRLTGAGLTSNGIKPGCQLPIELFNQSQVTDSQ
jgi:hypothetical protein